MLESDWLIVSRNSVYCLVMVRVHVYQSFLLLDSLYFFAVFVSQILTFNFYRCKFLKNRLFLSISIFSYFFVSISIVSLYFYCFFSFIRIDCHVN